MDIGPLSIAWHPPWYLEALVGSAFLACVLMLYLAIAEGIRLLRVRKYMEQGHGRPYECLGNVALVLVGLAYFFASYAYFGVVGSAVILRAIAYDNSGESVKQPALLVFGTFREAAMLILIGTALPSLLYVVISQLQLRSKCRGNI